MLKNLFIGFILEELRRHHPQGDDSKLSPSLSRVSSRDALEHRGRSGHSSSVSSSPNAPRKELKRSPNSGTVVCSSNMLPAVLPNVTSMIRSSPLLTPLIPLHTHQNQHPHLQLNVGNLPSIPQSPGALAGGAEATPTAGSHVRARSGTIDGAFPSSSLATPGPTPVTGGKDDYFSTPRVRQPSLQSGLGMATMGIGFGGGIGGMLPPGSPDDFLGWPGSASANANSKTEPQTPSTPGGGGLIGRLKNFGKTKRPISDTPASTSLVTPTTETAPALSAEASSLVEIPKTPLQLLLSGPLSPPATADAPLHHFPPTTSVLISVEGSPSYTTVYRGIVANTGSSSDVEALEATMPMWLVEYLLLGQVPGGAPGAPAKVSFVLMPWNKDPDGEMLPELLNTYVL